MSTDKYTQWEVIKKKVTIIHTLFNIEHTVVITYMRVNKTTGQIFYKRTKQLIFE